MESQILGRQATASNAVIPEEDAGEQSIRECLPSVRWTLQYVCVRTDIFVFSKKTHKSRAAAPVLFY